MPGVGGTVAGGVVPVWLAVAVMDIGAAVAVTAVSPVLAIHASAAIRRAGEWLSAAAGEVMMIGGLIVAVLALVPRSIVLRVVATPLELAAGVERPRTGRVSVERRDVWSDEAAGRLRRAWVPEHPDLTPYAALGEVMRLVCQLRGSPTQLGAAALARAGLSAVADRTVRERSMGQRRRALLAAALIGNPPNLPLVEPLEGMDRAMQQTIVAWVERRVADGARVLVATREIERFATLATRAVAVAGGHATLWGHVPAVATERLQQLDALARGEC